MQGLWKKTGTYRERPYVTFEGKYFILLESSNGLLYTSTLPVLNTADPSHFTMSEVQQQWIREENQDSEFTMNIWLPNMGNFPKNVIFFIFFNYRLDYHSQVEAEVILHDSLQVAENTSSATILGRMAADQKEPFR
ncbi:unnamed protein product [Cylicostephanus goldi]|uniref:Transmembrane protein 231 n=1 Tax=Cylicostephanus goldi TaxID=71465 RepID=A0A3P6U2T6_CYLGO|nr:unnamed protein product [Cylicostephanus goldi]